MADETMAGEKPETTKFPLDKPEDKTVGGHSGDKRPVSGDSPKPHGDPLADTIKGDKAR